jgi:hypothetical protein
LPLSKIEICKAIRKEAEQLFGTDLLGKCGICSYAVAEAFRKFGYKAEVKHGSFLHKYYGHCWVESDGEIYDITATQFSKRYFEKPKQYISKRFPKIYVTSLLKNDVYFNSVTVTDDERQFFFRNWKTGEYPSIHTIRKLATSAEELAGKKKPLWN